MATASRLHRFAFPALLAGVACGPRHDGPDGGAAGTDGTARAVSDGADHDASDASDSVDGESSDAVDTTAGRDCSQSDLPEPFCHEQVELDWPDDAGVLVEHTWNGVPGLLTISDADGMRLVNPFHANEVFAQAPAPFVIDTLPSTYPSTVNGDFDGDGTIDLALVSDGTLSAQFGVFDGATLQARADFDLADLGGLIWHVDAAAIDIDGDGVDELVTAEVTDALGVTVRLWSVDDALEQLDSISAGVPCSHWTFLPGDFDGDGDRDLAIVWLDSCDDWVALNPPRVQTLLAGTEATPTLQLHESPHPGDGSQAAAGDFDGDGDIELLIARSVQELHVLDWQAGAFAEVDVLTVGDYESISFGTLFPGRFVADAPAGVIVGNMYRADAEGEVEEVFHAALFPNSSTFKPVKLPYRLFPALDFNGDGVEDLFAPLADGYLLYRSL